jgi:hypothetical protein
MIRDEYQRLWDFMVNAPPGSKIDAARRAGVNLRFLVYLQLLTPTQRVMRMERACRYQDAEAALMSGARDSW